MKSNTGINAPFNEQIVRYTAYDEWAWLYNQTAGPAYRGKQLQFLSQVLFNQIAVDASILDLCCGTGQLMRPLIEKGYQLTGLDGSAQMLEYARKNAPAANLVLADAREFGQHQAIQGKQFNAVISTSASLNHIPSTNALTEIFHQVYQCLKPDSFFVFDINHPLQMATHWNQPYAGEGQIHRDYAWLITPAYFKEKNCGEFTVDIYRCKQGFKRFIYPLFNGITSHNKLYNLRLNYLRQFKHHQPESQHQQLSYTVYAHDVNQLTARLKQVGFHCVSVTDIAVNEVLSADDSAHFICYKKG